ncbi:MAG: head-tail connector protein [Proteobacteria bacterium]|nr:head-tail connector protein [Pseudomonadota bacterium]
MLIEESTLPDTALPVAPFRAHLRLGTGFGEDGLQDEVLRGFLRAALAAVEARTAKVLIARDFSLVLPDWQSPLAQPFPVAPVTAVGAVTLIDRLGVEDDLAPSHWRLQPDTHRPLLRPRGLLLPRVPTDGQVRIAFTAGMAPDWGALPADLAQAVLMLAAHYYEFRNDTALHDGCMPFGVTSLLERYRAFRLYGARG